jgi:hypothetical protein
LSVLRGRSFVSIRLCTSTLMSKLVSKTFPGTAERSAHGGHAVLQPWHGSVRFFRQEYSTSLDNHRCPRCSRDEQPHFSAAGSSQCVCVWERLKIRRLCSAKSTGVRQ